jgi:hypothetical protein
MLFGEWAVNHDLPVQSSVTVVTPSGFSSNFFT